MRSRWRFRLIDVATAFSSDFRVPQVRSLDDTFSVVDFLDLGRGRLLRLTPC